MNVLRDIPFHLDESDLRQKAHLAGLPEGLARDLLTRALPLARPKALYRVSYIGQRTGTTVEIDGTVFSSQVLAAKLREVERVFPYVATCGTELEPLGFDGGDLLSLYTLDAIKELALLAARDHLFAHLKTTYGAVELSSMNPGSGNARLWPLGQQRPLFNLLGDVEGAIGVRLTPSYLMQPNKTVSGILFPSEVHFESCQLCTREGCPRRRAPYSGTLAESLTGSHP